MNIAVFGAKGRVGSKVVEIAEQRGHTVYPIDISIGITKNNNEICACRVKEITINQNEEESNNKKEKHERINCTTNRFDAVIDFSTAAATAEVCEFCRQHHSPLVSGVTGRNEEQSQLIERLATELPVVCKSNFSVGVDMLHRLSEIVAKELADWDCEIVEIHRRGKLDAPSGTAKSLAATVAKQKSFKKVTVHSLRCGSNFGKHEIVFAANGESLTITHQAENVDIFANGAIVTAEKLVKQKKSGTS